MEAIIILEKNQHAPWWFRLVATQCCLNSRKIYAVEWHSAKWKTLRLNKAKFTFRNLWWENNYRPKMLKTPMLRWCSNPNVWTFNDPDCNPMCVYGVVELFTKRTSSFTKTPLIDRIRATFARFICLKYVPNCGATLGPLWLLTAASLIKIILQQV